MSVLDNITITVCYARKHDIFTERDDWDVSATSPWTYLTCHTCGLSWQRYNGEWRVVDYALDG